MSHFCVLVVSNTPDEVPKLLQPYHEYECTGIDDEYVVHHEETEDHRGTYQRLHEKGVISGTFAEFLQEDGADLLTEAEAKSENNTSDFYAVKGEDGEITAVYRKTNPNKKWDWWVPGGRWSGMLKLKEGAEGAVGEPGVMDSHYARGPDRADQARKRDIDVEGMRQQAADKAAETFDMLKPAFEGKEFPSWQHYREELYKGDIDAARKAYHEHPTIQAVLERDKEAGGLLPLFGSPDEYLCGGDRNKFIERAIDNAFCTFAVVTQDGQWFERGNMGWWGVVTDEKEDNTWEREFRTLVNSQPDDKLFTIVDCHI